MSDEKFKPFREVVNGMEAQLIAKATAEGLTVNDMSDEAKAEFKTLVDGERDAFLKNMGGNAVDDYAKLAAAAGKPAHSRKPTLSIEAALYLSEAPLSESVHREVGSQEK